MGVTKMQLLSDPKKNWTARGLWVSGSRSPPVIRTRNEFCLSSLQPKNWRRALRLFPTPHAWRRSGSLPAILTDKKLLHNRRFCVASTQNPPGQHGAMEKAEQKKILLQNNSTKQTIAIVGFGLFAHFLAETLFQTGCSVSMFSDKDWPWVEAEAAEEEPGDIPFLPNKKDLCEVEPDVIVLCTSICLAEYALRDLPLHPLAKKKKNTLLVCVTSVKDYDRDVILELLPQGFDVLFIHPMFGLEETHNGWENIPFIFEKVRVGIDCDFTDRFLHMFAQKGCRIVEISSSAAAAASLEGGEEEDWQAAGLNYMRQTATKLFDNVKRSFPNYWENYQRFFLEFIERPAENFDVYYGLFMYNNKDLSELKWLQFASNRGRDPSRAESLKFRVDGVGRVSFGCLRMFICYSSLFLLLLGFKIMSNVKNITARSYIRV